MKVDKIMNQADMAATLLGQLDMEHSMFTFSRNILTSTYTYPFAFYSSDNAFSFRDNIGVTAFDLKAETLSYEEPQTNKNRLNNGKVILQSVYDDLGSR